jgi:hypothetical protein
VVTGFVVGRGRPGSFLGYDRCPEQGPWAVSRVVRWLHRHTGLVGVEHVDRIDWDTDKIALVRGDLDHLTRAG